MLPGPHSKQKCLMGDDRFFVVFVEWRSGKNW
jgi:hypothetical protein